MSVLPSAMRSALTPRAVVALALVSLPTLLAFNQPPSPTALNQALAFGAWGIVLLTAGKVRSLRVAVAASVSLQAALAAVALAALCSAALRELPWSLALSAVGMTLAAIAVAAGGAVIQPRTPLLVGFFAAWVLAGTVSVLVGLAQVFAPSWPDGDWIARSGVPGRAVGNLRQPNHLATLLLWSVAALVPMLEMARHATGRRAPTLALAALFSLLLFGVVLSGSRTGLVGTGVLALWGLADRRLSRRSRALLIASPLICAASWWLLDVLVTVQGAEVHIGAAARIGESDPSAGRFAIWRDTVALIDRHPWLGVGFGEFNFAWSLTPFPLRHHAFFDHTHNLPLQLAVELGIPAALLILCMLAWALWQAFDRSRRSDGPDGVALRTAFVMVLLMALHSQLEYPLWYAYFLLPVAFAWGVCLGADRAPEAQATKPAGAWVRGAGIALLLGTAALLIDYRRVVVIFSPDDSGTSLAERIEGGRRSWLFAHHADYALVTTSDAPVALPVAFDRAPHYLLDTRLMIAWAQSLAARGDVDRARHLAARLREFRNPGAKAFFAPCDDPADVSKPFQCTPPNRVYDWRDFR